MSPHNNSVRSNLTRLNTAFNRNTKSSVCHAVIGCLMTLIVCPALAADTSLDNLLMMPLDQLTAVDTQVENGSKMVDDFKGLPQAVTVLSASDIRAFGYRTLAEIIGSLPGIHTSSDHAYTYLGARGMIASGSFNSRLLITIDGMQTNDNIYQQVGLAGQEFPLDVDLIDRVEFIPGPGSVAFGNNAFLGVVNVITRSAASREHGEIASSIDSNGELVGRGTANFAVGAGHAMVSLTQYNHPGVAHNYPAYNDTPSMTTQPEVDRDNNQKVFVKYEKGPLYFNFIYSDRVKGVPSGISDTQMSNPYNQFKDTWLISNLNYRLVDTANTELVTRLHWGNYRFNARYAYSDTSIGTEASEGSWVGIELKGVWRGIKGHSLSAGVQTQENYRQWLYSSAIDTSGSKITYIDSGRQTQVFAAWLEDQFQISAQGKLIVGARVDQDMQQRTHLSPRLGGVYQLDSRNTLRANLARNFLSPSDYELRYANADIALAAQAPNPLLIPESMESLDLGWEHNNAHWGRMVLSGFVYRANDLIELMINTADQPQHFNVGSSIGKGVQAEWQHNWSSQWRISTSATVQTVTDQGVGQRVDSPEKLFKLQLKTPKFFSIQPAIEWLYLSERFDRTMNQLSATNLVNLTLSRAFSHQVTARLSVYNLLDQQYESPVSVDYPMSAVRQNGRVIRLKLEWNF